MPQQLLSAYFCPGSKVRRIVACRLAATKDACFSADPACLWTTPPPPRPPRPTAALAAGAPARNGSGAIPAASRRRLAAGGKACVAADVRAVWDDPVEMGRLAWGITHEEPAGGRTGREGAGTERLVEGAGRRARWAGALLAPPGSQALGCTPARL